MNISYSQYRYELKIYVRKIISSQTILENDTVDKLEIYYRRLEGFRETLDKAVADVTFNTIDKLMKDIIDPNNTRGVKGSLRVDWIFLR